MRLIRRDFIVHTVLDADLEVNIVYIWLIIVKR